MKDSITIFKGEMMDDGSYFTLTLQKDGKMIVTIGDKTMKRKFIEYEIYSFNTLKVIFEQFGYDNIQESFFKSFRTAISKKEVRNKIKAIDEQGISFNCSNFASWLKDLH